MQIFGFGLTFFGILIIVFPQIIAYMIGGMIIFFGVSILLFTYGLKNKKSANYVQFGDFKIYKDK